MSEMFEDVADRHLDLGLRAASRRDASRAERRLARRITARLEGREGLGARRLAAAAVVLAGVGITFAVARSVGDGGAPADLGPAISVAPDEGLAERRADGVAAIGVERAPDLRWTVGGVRQPAVAPAVAVLREQVAGMQDPVAGRQDPVSIKIVPGAGATHADVVATLDALLAAGFAQIDIEGVALGALIPVFDNGPDLAPARFAVPSEEQPFRGAAVWIDGEGRMFVRVSGASRDEGPMGPEELAVALARSMAALERGPAGAPFRFDDFGEALQHGVGTGAGAGAGRAPGGSGTAGPRPPAGGSGSAGPRGPAGAGGAPGSSGTAGPRPPAGGSGSAGPRGPARAGGAPGASGTAGPQPPAGGAGRREGGDVFDTLDQVRGEPRPEWPSIHDGQRSAQPKPKRQLFFSMSRDDAQRAGTGAQDPGSAGRGEGVADGSTSIGVGGGSGGAMGFGSGPGTGGSQPPAGAASGSSASASGGFGGSDAIGIGSGGGGAGFGQERAGPRPPSGFAGTSAGGGAVPLAVWVAIPGETSWAETALPALRACAAAGFERVHLAVRRDESSRMR